MEQPIRKPTRTEELRDLLEKWEQRLYPVFLQLGLDVRDFWQRWDSGRGKDAPESVRDLKVISEMVIATMNKAGFDARPGSLETLADLTTE